MKFGVTVSTGLTRPNSPEGEAEYVTGLASVAEEAGFDSVWCADRTVYPADLAERYPAQYGPERGGPDGQKVLEAMTALAFLAGRTSTITVGFCVMVLPFRHPVLNAKMVTTLDVLSGGRVIFGAGLGWMPEEFEAIGAPRDDRGAQTDEHIEMFKALCTEDVADFQGEHFRTSGMVFFPKPLQKPHPPVWIGGRTGLATRRAARLGDGWVPNSMTPEEVTAGLHKLRRLCEAEGRDPGAVTMALSVTLRPGSRIDEAAGAPHLSGSAQEVADLVGEYQGAGVEHLIISVAEEDVSAAADAVIQFAEQVIPAV